MFITDQEATEGVVFNYSDQLACSGTSLPLTVQEGAAVGYGLFYENTADFEVSGTSTPAIGTTGGRINVVYDWSAQTGKIQANQNTDGVASIPSLTQTAGVLWELPLYTYTVTTGGVVTLTDTRSYCHFGTKVDNQMLDDGIVTADKLASNAVTNAKMADNSVDTAELVDGAVTLAKIGSNAVDDTKAGNRVPFLYRREGGDSNDWHVTGTSIYTPGAVMMQAGAGGFLLDDGLGNASKRLGFPVAFSQPPLVFLTLQDATAPEELHLSVATDSGLEYSTSGCYISITRDGTSGNENVRYFWLAIGTE